MVRPCKVQYKTKALAIVLDSWRGCWRGNLLSGGRPKKPQRQQQSGQKGKYQTVPMDTRGISAASAGCDWCTWPSMEPNPLAAGRMAVLIGCPLAHGNFVWAPSSTEQKKVNRGGGKKNQIEGGPTVDDRKHGGRGETHAKRDGGSRGLEIITA